MSYNSVIARPTVTLKPRSGKHDVIDQETEGNKPSIKVKKRRPASPGTLYLLSVRATTDASQAGTSRES
jgi:hypothetical protein